MAAGDEGHLVCGQSAFRAIAAVTQWAFHSPKAAMQRTPASGKGSAENRAAIPASASILPRSWHWARAAPPAYLQDLSAAATDTKTDRSSRHQLSNRVPA